MRKKINSDIIMIIIISNGSIFFLIPHSYPHNFFQYYNCIFINRSSIIIIIMLSKYTSIKTNKKRNRHNIPCKQNQHENKGIKTELGPVSPAGFLLLCCTKTISVFAIHYNYFCATRASVRASTNQKETQVVENQWAIWILIKKKNK